MQVFIYLQDNIVAIGSSDSENIEEVARLSVPTGIPFFIVDSEYLPIEPQGAWVLNEDGTLTIDQEKLIQIKREQMPRLQPMDFDLKLNQYELYDAVQDLIATDRELYIAYNRATYFSRTDQFVEKARIALNLSHEKIDEIWS